MDKTKVYVEFLQMAAEVAELVAGDNAAISRLASVLETSGRYVRLALATDADIAEDLAEQRERLKAILDNGGLSPADIDEQLARMEAVSGQIEKRMAEIAARIEGKR